MMFSAYLLVSINMSCKLCHKRNDTEIGLCQTIEIKTYGRSNIPVCCLSLSERSKCADD